MMNSVPKCEDLAPYLRQKLEQDKEYSWQTAPYIHEEVRAALREAEYPVSSPYRPACRRIYSDLMNIYNCNANSYVRSASVQAELQKWQMESAQMQINQDMIDMLRNSAQQIIHRR